MKDFDDLIEAKDKAVADEEECAKAEHEAFHVHADAQQKHSESVDVLAECHKAIHDVLAEKGEHYGIDQSTGTVTVYKPIDQKQAISYMVGGAQGASEIGIQED